MAIFVSGWINIGLAESSRPNLLVIMTDDQGRWSIGEYDRRIKTPNIDYIAEPVSYTHLTLPTKA